MSEPLLTHKGTPFRVSISCLDTFTDCPRKGWYGYVERRRGPGTEATIVGSKIHDVAEKYLKGEEVDHTSRYFRCLEPGLIYAPTPEAVISEGWGVEDWVKGTCGNLPFTGKVDIYNKAQAIVSDWKTKKDTSWAFALTPDKLAEAGQPHAYAYNIFKEDPPSTVDFQHIYVTRRGKPAAMEVWAYNVPWTHIEEKWQELEAQSRQVEAIARNNEVAESVTANVAVCRKYGGCEHAEYCAASPQNRAAKAAAKVTNSQEATMSQKSGTSSRLAALRAKLGAAKSPSAPITPTPPVARTLEPAAPSPRSEQKAFAEALDQMTSMLDEMPEVPVRVARMLMTSLGADLNEVAAELGLVLKDGKYSLRRGPPPTSKVLPPEAPVDEAPAPKKGPDPGTSVREAEEAGFPSGSFASFGLKVLGGLLVPQFYAGTVTQAYQEFRPGTPEAQAAKAIDKVDPPEVAPLETEEEPTPSASSSDLDAAGALLAALHSAGRPIPKTKASLIVREAIPGVQRIRAERWEAIFSASGNRLEWAGTKLALSEDALTQTAVEVPAPALEAEVLAEKVEEVMAPISAATNVVGPGRAEVLAKLGIIADLETENEHLEKENERVQGEYDDLLLKALAHHEGNRPTVYIDCLPMGQLNPVDFAVWVGDLEDQVANEMGLMHPGVADFAKGLNNVLGKVMALLHADGPAALPEGMYISSQHPMASRVVPLLKRLGEAVHVVRGVK